MQTTQRPAHVHDAAGGPTTLSLIFDSSELNRNDFPRKKFVFFVAPGNMARIGYFFRGVLNILAPHFDGERCKTMLSF
jgi:hypothetical protein